MYGAIAGVEAWIIDEKTRLREFRNELRWNDAAHLRSS
jgi:L-arabinose isomerase